MNLAITAVLADGPRIWPLDGPTIRIGRAPGNAVRIHDLLISREHAEIVLKGRRVLLRDLRSENGTLLNGVPVRRSTEVRIGDIIQVGPVTFHIVPRPPSPYVASDGPTERLSTIKLPMADVLGREPGRDACPGEQLRLLENAGRLLVQQRPLRATCEEFLRVVEMSVPASRLILYQVLEPTRAPVQIAARSHGRRVTESPFLPEETLRAILELQTVVMPEGEAAVPDPENRPDARTAPRSAVAVPLVHENKALGFLYVDHDDPGFRYATESLELLTLFANMAAVRIANDAHMEAEKQQTKIDHELAMASRIQRWLLPTHPPVVKGYEFDATIDPCEKVGGDFYDFQPTEDGTIWFMLGDVRGKGICAAIVMALIVSSARVLYEHCGGPGSLANRLNAILRQRTEEGNFATAFLGVLEPSTGVIRYVNAGHPYPMILHGRTIRELESNGPALGWVSDFHYEAKSAVLEPGELLALFTDGIPEAMRNERFFGIPRIARALRANAGLQDLAATGRSIVSEVDSFLSGQPRSDDVALVLLRRGRESK